MEPSLIGWEWSANETPVRAKHICRNGAQPYRLGMDADVLAALVAFLAAMEPSLIGWEWPRRGSQSCCPHPRRNGAQPYRLGMAGMGGAGRHGLAWPQWSPALSAGNGCSTQSTSTAPRGRNGAQPYRLGMGGRGDFGV